MDYWMFGGNPSGGLPRVSETMPAGSTLVSVSTDDIEASLAKATALGATTLVPKSEIPGMGWYAVFVDPTGNRVGLYTGLPGQG
jgi:predicted enzyme related to lactoylglutathione lyase